MPTDCGTCAPLGGRSLPESPAQRQCLARTYYVELCRTDTRGLRPSVRCECLGEYDERVWLTDRRFRPGKFKFLNPSGLPDTPKLWVKCVLLEGTDEVYRSACVELRGGDHLPAYSAEL